MRLIGKLTPKLSLYGTISKAAEVIGSNVQPLTVRNNGTYEASSGVDGFNPVYVNTPEPKEEQIKTLNVGENGFYEVLPDNEKVLSSAKINVNVPPKEEQEKTADITENGTTEVLPDENKVLSKVTVNVDVAGGGTEYSSIVYNEDNTITLTDTEGNEHTMVCTYDDTGKLVEVSYDGKSEVLIYEGDNLVVGGTEIVLKNAPISDIEPLDHTITFTADGKPYEIVSVKGGNSVNAPATEPRSESGVFQGWQNGENLVEFPYIPEKDTNLSARFIWRSNTDYLYESFGIDKATFPYVVIGCTDKGDGNVSCKVYFANKFSDIDGRVVVNQGRTYKSLAISRYLSADIYSQDDICDKIVEYNPSVTQATVSSGHAYTDADTTVYYTNDTADTFSEAAIAKIEYLS